MAIDRSNMTREQATWLLCSEPNIMITNCRAGSAVYRVHDGRIELSGDASFEMPSRATEGCDLFSDYEGAATGCHVVDYERENNPLEALLPELKSTAYEACSKLLKQWDKDKADYVAGLFFEDLKALVAILDERYQLKEGK